MIPARLLPQTIAVRRFLGSGAYGDIYDDEPTLYPARVQRENTLVRDAEGQEVVSSAKVVTVPACDCPPGSRVQLPDETTERTTIAYRPQVGARAVHHVEIDVS